jgi:hypothetical protein
MISFREKDITWNREKRIIHLDKKKQIQKVKNELFPNMFSFQTSIKKEQLISSAGSIGPWSVSCGKNFSQNNKANWSSREY